MGKIDEQSGDLGAAALRPALSSAAPIEPASGLAADALQSTSAGWACGARGQSLPETADCGWPLCGCDPHASTVLEALDESGFVLVPKHPTEAMIRAVDKAAMERWPNARKMAVAMHAAIVSPVQS